MVNRMAACMSLFAFALCVVVGGFEVDNPFGTTISRALLAMITTLVIGLIVGTSFKAMLNENLKTATQNLKLDSERLKIPPGSPVEADR